MTSSDQELPAWRAEQPTFAGNPEVASYPQESGVESNKNNDKCCNRLVKKCGPIGWYFSPILDRLGYSLLTVLYHYIMFPYTLAVFIIAVTLFSVSVGLLILVFGIILYWFTCEICVILARFDLAMAYYFVEDNEEILSRRGRSIRLSLYKQLAPCCCYSTSGGCSNGIWSRMKSLICRCDTYKIYLHQMIFKPIIVLLTCWIPIVCTYIMGSVFAPIVWLCYSPVFTKHYWCPLGGNSCNNGKCTCESGVEIENFGDALLFGLCALLVLPLSFWLSIWFAKASKAVSYLFLSDHYNKNKNQEISNLLCSPPSNNNNHNNNDHVRDISVSVDGQKPTQANMNHSLNFDPQV